VLTADHVEKMFELLVNHHRLEEADGADRSIAARILSRVEQTFVIAHVKASQQPCERVAIRRRSGYNAIARTLNV
jgi:hypothetical protein